MNRPALCRFVRLSFSVTGRRVAQCRFVHAIYRGALRLAPAVLAPAVLAIGLGVAICRSSDAQTAAAPPASLRVLELANELAPNGTGRIEDLENYKARFQQRFANDPRLFAFDVHVHPEANAARRLQLAGYAEFPELKEGIVELYRALGFEVEASKLATLPVDHPGDSPFGLVNASRAFCRSRPDAASDVVTECLYGEPLFLLLANRGHYLVHGGEGYLGFIREQDVHRVDRDAFANRLQSAIVTIREDWNAAGNLIPQGAQLPWIRNDDGDYIVQLPNGSEKAIPMQIASINDNGQLVENVVDSCKKRLGTPYVWGGKSSKGIDCSGLIQVGYAAAGIPLPRDSNQQVYLGHLVATRWFREGMRRGDTMYFLGSAGRIRHTALYLGHDEFIQAESPVVAIRSLNPQAENYDARRAATFAFAKRIVP